MTRLPRTLRVLMRDIAWRPERFTRAECCHAKGAMTSGAGRKRRSSCRRRDLRLATYDSGGMGHHGLGPARTVTGKYGGVVDAWHKLSLPGVRCHMCGVT